MLKYACGWDFERDIIIVCVRRDGRMVRPVTHEELVSAGIDGKSLGIGPSFWSPLHRK